METETAVTRPREVATLAATPGILESLLAPVTPAELVWKPAPERWSVAEVLAHLVEVEERVIGLRVRRIAGEELPLLEPYDPGAFAGGGGASLTGDGRAARAAFDRVRGETVAFLDGLPAAARERRGRHPEVGEITIAQLLNQWAFHDLAHLRQIAELLRAVEFWDGLGSLQRYYSVRP